MANSFLKKRKASEALVVLQRRRHLGRIRMRILMRQCGEYAQKLRAPAKFAVRNETSGAAE